MKNERPCMQEELYIPRRSIISLRLYRKTNNKIQTPKSHIDHFFFYMIVINVRRHTSFCMQIMEKITKVLRTYLNREDRSVPKEKRKKIWQHREQTDRKGTLCAASPIASYKGGPFHFVCLSFLSSPSTFPFLNCSLSWLFCLFTSSLLLLLYQLAFYFLETITPYHFSTLRFNKKY